MKLFYDSKTLQFCLNETETTECVFETYNSERTGWKKGKNPEIKKGNVKLKIATNFWPDNVSCEYFFADIYLNDILLLPLSSCYDNEKYLPQYHTIYMRHDDFDWTSLMESVCQISNHSDAWINNECERLLIKLPIDSTNIEEQLKVLKTIRLYDSFNPFFQEKYRSHFDKLLFENDNIKILLDKALAENNDASLELFDLAWNYMKDYKEHMEK